MDFDFKARVSESPLVETIWHTRTGSESSPFISKAEYFSEMVITKQYGKTTLSIRGPEDRATVSDVPEDAEFLGIVLKLGSYMPKLPPIDLINNKSVHLEESAYNSIWLGSAWQIPTYENVDTFISRLVREGLLVYDPLVTAVLENKPLDISLRTIQRRFLQATGLSHKTIQQIDRAKKALSLLEQGRSILDTSYELGYSDQAHLANSLKHYLGENPSQIKAKAESLEQSS